MLAPALVDAWLAELDAAGRAALTVAGHRWHLLDTFAGVGGQLGVPVEHLDLSSVTRAQLVEALRSYRHAPDRRYTSRPRAAITERAEQTMDRRLSSVRAFFAWAARVGHLPVNPAADLPQPTRHAKLPRAFEVDDALRLYDTAATTRFPARDTALVAVALGAGPRLAEMVGMTIDDVLGRPPHQIRVLGKGGQERNVPLTGRGRDALEAYLPVRTERLRRWDLTSPFLWVPHRLLPDRVPGAPRLSREGMADTFDRLLTEAGLRAPGRRVHVLRGTTATALLRAGRSPREVQTLLGHTSLATTAKYLLVTGEDLANTVAANPLG